MTEIFVSRKTQAEIWRRFVVAQLRADRVGTSPADWQAVSNAADFFTREYVHRIEKIERSQDNS